MTRPCGPCERLRSSRLHLAACIVLLLYLTCQLLTRPERWLDLHLHSECTPFSEPLSVSNVSATQVAASSAGSLVVFFNIYQRYTERASGIVAEQLGQLKEAKASGANISRVKYVTIGDPEDKSYDCDRCEKVAHCKTGDEIDTLQLLYDHCVAGRSEYVTYIHTKGAFHIHGGKNEAFRRYLMKGVTAAECTHMPSSCDVCGARFSPQPHHHYPGNMWVARCDYVRKLLPPSKFGAAMDAVVTEFQKSPGETPWVVSIGEGWAVGTGRFASEHWVASHPSVTPCDVDTSRFEYGCQVSKEFKPILRVGPRFELFRNSSLSVGLLEWRLFEWRHLYNTTPPEGSWAWKLYGQ